MQVLRFFNDELSGDECAIVRTSLWIKCKYGWI